MWGEEDPLFDEQESRPEEKEDEADHESFGGLAAQELEKMEYSPEEERVWSANAQAASELEVRPVSRGTHRDREWCEPLMDMFMCRIYAPCLRKLCKEVAKNWSRRSSLWRW